MPATIETTPPLPGLSPVNEKAVTARFDGGSLSSDAGLLALREVERRIDVAGRLSAASTIPARGVDFILGLPTTTVLRGHVATLEASTAARAKAADGATVRRFKEFYDGAGSWSRVERIIARVEAGPRGCDTRFIVTSLTRGAGKTLYEGVYCARGQAENHIKGWKTHLAADRTSCSSAAANQLRLFLHAGAYWLMWTLRAALPKRSPWRCVQFDTLRLRVVEMKTRITLHLPSGCPAAPLMRLLLERLPRMAPV